MEVQREKKPKNNFLKKVRNITKKNKIVLIFDECTSGFREGYGGLHKKYGVNPDMAMFGKAMGNGYAITSIIGKSEIMNEAQSTFISSTFWTERSGYVAPLKSLEIMDKIKILLNFLENSNDEYLLNRIWKMEISHMLKSKFR